MCVCVNVQIKTESQTQGWNKQADEWLSNHPSHPSVCVCFFLLRSSIHYPSSCTLQLCTAKNTFGGMEGVGGQPANILAGGGGIGLGGDGSGRGTGRGRGRGGEVIALAGPRDGRRMSREWTLWHTVPAASALPPRTSK